MKFDEALDELNKALADPNDQRAKQPRPEDEAAGFAMLQAMVGGSDFKGKGR